jgi:hypothetical protein
MKRRLYLLIIFFIYLQLSIAGNLFVTVNGSDSNDGSQLHPLASVKQALLMAREYRRLNNSAFCKDGIHIILRGGTYCLAEPIFIRPEDSGTNLSPTYIEAESHANVTISGGVNVKGWKKVGNLWMAKAPITGGRYLQVRQLWNNSTRALRAKQYAKDSLTRMINFDKKNKVIWIPTPKDRALLTPLSNKYQDGSQMEMLVHQRWAIAILRVKEMKSFGDSTRVTFYDPESYLEFSHPWPQPVIGGEHGNSSFCLMNDLRLVNETDEWYQAYPSGYLFYKFSNDSESKKANVIVPVTKQLVVIQGAENRRVKNIVFRNIKFMHTAWLRPSEQGHVTLQAGFPLIDAYKLLTPGLPEKAELENQAWIERPEAAIEIQNADFINFLGCDFQHMGSTAIDFKKSVSTSTICECHFSDIGGSAIIGGSFAENGYETHVPFNPVNEKEICSSITINKNTIYNTSVEDWGCPAISLGYVKNTLIDHNEVAHVNYSGICVGWGWTAEKSCMSNNIIHANYIHDFARQLYDAGGIYTLSNQPESMITGNRIDSIGEAPYATNNRAFYIYFDEATDGYTVENNIMPDTTKIGYNKPGQNLKVRR